MADKKISELISSTTPLAGTEVLPVVQSSATRKTTVESVLTSVQPSGTANSVVFLNGSKVATTGSGLKFDGKTLGVGVTPENWYESFGTKAFQVAGSVMLAGLDVSNTDRRLYLGNNFYLNSTGVQTYTNTGAATRYFTAAGKHEFSTAPSGTADTSVTFTNRLEIELGGDIKVNTGNLVIGTAGKGIDFSADPNAGGMTSELFDDYEEGTWTPTYGTTNSDLANYSTFGSSRQGKYTKVGDIVTVYCSIATQNAASISGTGRIIITGLPFAPSCNANAGIKCVVLTTDNRFTNPPSFGEILNGQTQISLYKTSNMNSANALTVADFNAADTANFNLLSFVAVYQTA